MRSRLTGIDAARGIALLGMMAVHTIGTPDDGVGVVHTVFDGRASALFAVLAGVGISLANGGPTPSGNLSLGRRRIAVRAVVIALIGLTLGDLGTPAAVILVYYAVLFLVALPVLGWGATRLAVAAAVAAVVTPVLSQALRVIAYPGGPATGANLTWSRLLDPGEVASTVLFTGYYPVLTWSTYLLAGMAVGRLPLRSPEVVKRLGVTGVALALAGWLAAAAGTAAAGGARALVERRSGGSPGGTDYGAALHDLFHGITPASSWWFLVTDAPHSGAIPDLVHTTGTTLLVIALMLALCARLGERAVLLRPLTSAGAMTLTLYSAHVVLLGASPRLNETDWIELTVHAGLALVVATLWNAPHRTGPLEAVTAEVVDVTTLSDARR